MSYSRSRVHALVRSVLTPPPRAGYSIGQVIERHRLRERRGSGPGHGTFGISRHPAAQVRQAVDRGRRPRTDIPRHCWCTHRSQLLIRSPAPAHPRPPSCPPPVLHEAHEELLHELQAGGKSGRAQNNRRTDANHRVAIIDPERVLHGGCRTMHGGRGGPKELVLSFQSRGDRSISSGSGCHCRRNPAPYSAMASFSSLRLSLRSFI